MVITFKAVSEETGGEYSLYELTVLPQLGAPPHIHHRETEAYYVLDGEVEFLKGERTVRAGVGDFVHVPGGVVHAFTNVGQVPARFLGIVTPGGLHEKLLSSLGKPAKTETYPHTHHRIGGEADVPGVPVLLGRARLARRGAVQRRRLGRARTHGRQEHVEDL